MEIPERLTKAYIANNMLSRQRNHAKVTDSSDDGEVTVQRNSNRSVLSPILEMCSQWVQ
jgi:hypothetical protein